MHARKKGMKTMEGRIKMRIQLNFLLALVFGGLLSTTWAEEKLIRLSKLEMFVDDIPEMPKIKGYSVVNGVFVPKHLKIGMFLKKWKFHRDIPATPVFAYGTSKHTATVPGPTIEAVHGISTYVRWQNLLPSKHILPYDTTIPTATSAEGIPTVVHLHGNIGAPSSDGHAEAWFTRGFRQKGSTWSKKTYHYGNDQQPGNLWYHDHAMGLTRVNLLAGLVGAYMVRDPKIEAPLGLPSDDFDRTMIVFDRGFYANGSLFMNSTGDNPSVHPQWQPEYFGDLIIVNGKAWPSMIVRRRKYRFRIINASNARFFKFSFTNALDLILVGSDSVYLERPVFVKEILLAPSEITDFVVDFSKSNSDSAILENGAPYPYPSGDPVNEANSKVMKFIIKGEREVESGRVPDKLIEYPRPDLSTASGTRYISMYEYTSSIDEPTHLYINGKTYEAPVTEMPKVGTTEIWYVINLTEDNHPLHIHLGLFSVLEQTELENVDGFKDCMLKVNDAVKCDINKYARAKKVEVLAHEKGWKNVYKMQPGFVTKILVRFGYIHTNSTYSFDATAEPGYAYHCHILDHEDNVMMRPLKLIK